MFVVSNAVIAALSMVSLPLALGAITKFPLSPCPDVFQYVVSSSDVAGHVTVPNDQTGNQELTVNMSVAALIGSDQNIRLQFLSSLTDLNSGKPLEYLVIFPAQDVIPKVTQVTTNGRVICIGPPETITPGGSVTNMWANSYIRTNKVPVGFRFGVLPTQTLPTFSSPMPQRQTPPSESAPFTSPYLEASTEPVKLRPARPVKCGVATSVQNLVLGGVASEEGEFPWLAAIMYTDGNTYRLKCNGNLVSDRHVVTAGHCLRYYNAPLIADENVVVVMGKGNIKNWPLGVTRGIARVHVHPNYKQDSPDSNVVVVELSESVKFSSTVAPVCLWEGDNDLNRIVGQEGTVVGWGPNQSDGDFSPRANKVNMPVVSQEQCLRSHKAFVNLSTPKTFCAGKRDGTGPCMGDSGSGFLLRIKGAWYLRGLAGFSLADDATRSCDLGNYVIFTDLAKDQQWMKSIVGS